MVKKSLSLLALSISLFCALVAPVSAAGINNGDLSTAVVDIPVYFDEYSSVSWPSLSAAKAYYGYDFVYTPCAHFYNGSYYNYYTFPSGPKLFFYAQIDDDDSVRSISTDESAGG